MKARLKPEVALFLKRNAFYLQIFNRLLIGSTIFVVLYINMKILLIYVMILIYYQVLVLAWCSGA